MPAAPHPPEDIESIERATLAALPPQAQLERDGWLLALDHGTVGRAHSAVPLRHAPPPADVLARLEREYRGAGLTPLLRVPMVAPFDAFRAQLLGAGYRASRPTVTQTAAAGDVAGVGDASRATLAGGFDEEAAAVFLGEGFDPVDAASRLAILGRAGDSTFASVRVDGRVVAVGTGCCSHGWCGVHGMRTLPRFRGAGCASAILAALAQEAGRRGVDRVFLQVEQGNARAQALYARAGFAPAWTYEYWRAP